MTLDATFFAFLGLIVFFAIVIGAGAHKIALRGLDDRAGRIAGELQEAERLRAEAQTLLVDYERKRAAAASEAESIVKQAKADAAALRADAERALAADLARRERMAAERIARAEAQAQADIRAAAAEAAIAAAERLLRAEIEAKGHGAIVQRGVAELQRSFAA